jgi:glutamate-1-semialdehyde 2,1-aminomutase
MYPELQKELETFERRTPKSAEAHKRNLKRLPLGVASNYRAYDPYPIFVKEGQGSHFRDLDGNDYIDHNLCFGALMAGHCHPAVMKAVEKRLTTGTMFGMPHDMEWQLAEEICKRRWKWSFCSSGTRGHDARGLILAPRPAAKNRSSKAEPWAVDSAL